MVKKVVLAELTKGALSKLHHKSFSNSEYADIICLGLTNAILSHLRRLNMVDNTRFVEIGNKVSNKVVALVRRRFKIDDGAVLIE